MDVFKEFSRMIVFPIDYESQNYLNRLKIKLLYSGIVASCVIGYSTNSLLNLLYTFIGVYIMALVIILPAYPNYNKYRLQWVVSGSTIATPL